MFGPGPAQVQLVNDGHNCGSPRLRYLSGFKPSAQYTCHEQSSFSLDAPDIRYLLSKFKQASCTIGL